MECPSIHCHDSIKEPPFLFEQPLSVVQHTFKFIMRNFLLLDKFHNFSIREALNGGNCSFSSCRKGSRESLCARSKTEHDPEKEVKKKNEMGKLFYLLF